MSSSRFLISLLFLFLSLFSHSNGSLSSQGALAAKILYDSGFVSMSTLTFEMLGQSIEPTSPSLTIFAPPDSVFKSLGQTSISMIRFHFTPLLLRLQTLRPLPVGTKIPTLLSGHSLIVTESLSDSGIWLNNVKIATESPIYDDGFIIILEIGRFFDPNYLVSAPVVVSRPSQLVNGAKTPNTMGDSLLEEAVEHHPFPASPPSISQPPRAPMGASLLEAVENPSFPASSRGTNLQPVNGANTMGASMFEQVGGVLACNGYAHMASFLELQLPGLKLPSRLTVFAPLDQAMDKYHVLQDASFFLRHMVPTRLTWTDMFNFSEGLVLETYLEEFNITISRSGNVLLLNQVPVYKANLFRSEFLVVHGLKEPLPLPGGTHHQEQKRFLVVLGHSLSSNNSTPASVMVVTTTQPANAGLSTMKIIGYLTAIVVFLVGLVCAFYKWVFTQTVQVTMDTAIATVQYTVLGICGALSTWVVAGVAVVTATLARLGMAAQQTPAETSTIQMASTMNGRDIENQQPEPYINISNIISAIVGAVFAGAVILSF